MNTKSLAICLPEPINAFVESEVVDGGFGSASEYICALIQEAQRRKTAEAFEAILMAGLDPADASRLTAAQWEEHKRLHRERRLQELRQEIALGLEQLNRGEVVAADEALREFRERNPYFTRQSP
jgi:antitoxin ParD1/3/4